ncbi:uncharacterized protein LOC126213240 isoform X3 [Schistocerca nitens]|uniref:uncharacterized protein LOC126213240 isoform X3 n=1 Tax=Schistocerca nitens TaxID=7011 RepID=UPI002117C6B1|nr:uncharacterized protein LOC126213240 isoform X3 [Schistocerca nitens]
MDQEPATWIKKEELDEVKTEIPFMAQVYPLSMNVKEELEEGANKESIEDPLGISWSTDFIKEDPELNLELSVAENIISPDTLAKTCSYCGSFCGACCISYKIFSNRITLYMAFGE